MHTHADKAEKVHGVAELVHILENYLEDMPHFLGKIDSLETYAQKVLEYGNVYVIKSDAHIKGFVIFYANDSRERMAYISLIAVSKEFRRQKMGTELLWVCEKISKEMGMKGVRLEVDRDNLKAQRFYESLGFYVQKDQGAESFYMEKIYKDSYQREV